MSNTPFDLAPFDDGYVDEPPAPEPKSKLTDGAPGGGNEPDPVERVVRQTGHRLAIAATLLLVGAVAATLRRADAYWLLLLLTFVTADATLVCGLVASWLQRGRVRGHWEPLGIVIYSIVLLLPTVALVVLAKTERLAPLVTRLVGEPS